MKNPTNISIRVRLQDEMQSELVAHENVIILWDRIIAAVLLFALLVGLLLVGIQYWRAVEPPLHLNATGADVDFKPPVRDHQGETESNLPLSVADEMAVVPLNDHPDQPIMAEFSTPTATEPEPAVEITQQPELATVKLYSGEVQRAQLTTEMVSRQPNGAASAHLYVKSDELLTVFFYIEIANHRAQPIYFNWYRNNKRAAKVAVRPKHQLTKTFSSKYIDVYMAGDWRVELTNGVGELLAVSRFKVELQD